MNDIVKKYVDGDYEVVEYSSGTIVRTLISTDIPFSEQPQQQPTLEEQIIQLKEDNLILMDALATIYETLLSNGGAV